MNWLTTRKSDSQFSSAHGKTKQLAPYLSLKWIGTGKLENI